MAKISQETNKNLETNNVKTQAEYEKEIKKLQKELKREKTISKNAEKFEKELKEQRKAFDEIADISMLYVTTDKDLKIKEISRAFGDFFGYTRDELIDEKYNILVDYEDAQKFYNGCEYVSTHNKEAWGTDMKMISRDNRVLYTHTFIYPLFEAGVLKGFTFVIKDINDKYVLTKWKVDQLKKEKYQETTLEFMKNTSVAILNTVNSKVSLVVKIIFFIIMVFMIWAISFDIEEIVKGSGKIIPTTKVKHIRNLDGGVVEKFYVTDGANVKNGQLLLKLSDVSYRIKLHDMQQQVNQLMAKMIRLKAESQGTSMKVERDFTKEHPILMKLERGRYLTDIKETNSKVGKFLEQLKSKQSTLEDDKNAFLVIEENYLSLSEELADAKKLYQKDQVFSKYDIAKKQRDVNDMMSKLVSAKEKIKQDKSAIDEIKNQIREAKLNFRNSAKEQYSKAFTDYTKLLGAIEDLQETIKRTNVKSPVNGTVKELLVNTVGSSVNPNEELLSIVPNNAAMVAEVKIKPSDIGKLYIGQKLTLKVTAYDYSLYGNLEGEIINISPDTIEDPKTKKAFYSVKIRTKLDYLDNNKKNKLKVGMLVNTSIIVGKKSILSFVLKPILKSTQKGSI